MLLFKHPRHGEHGSIYHCLSLLPGISLRVGHFTLRPATFSLPVTAGGKRVRSAQHIPEQVVWGREGSGGRSGGDQEGLAGTRGVSGDQRGLAGIQNAGSLYADVTRPCNLPTRQLVRPEPLVRRR
ncbi:hypothetical protein E2C01_019432 [Portunus trituberculatus]|uniref:Uncharacterized protein n=1 Tax=Portunus trituberculatus TaxID=210409 RepID=A0A5B7DZC1_PORTR|nr:hypothetical protein [Portunus trituberculatus]